MPEKTPIPAPPWRSVPNDAPTPDPNNEILVGWLRQVGPTYIVADCAVASRVADKDGEGGYFDARWYLLRQPSVREKIAEMVAKDESPEQSLALAGCGCASPVALVAALVAAAAVLHWMGA